MGLYSIFFILDPSVLLIKQKKIDERFKNDLLTVFFYFQNGGYIQDGENL